ncbi:3-isopropylmalate dehydratase [Pseudomonas sp. LRF_L74]|uniref:3-isopropylmalate dehydratase n=1 Tax=Pseudomonas sp. LRF_L74 TaxID=3369422 RepID=UPI003F5D891C
MRSILVVLPLLAALGCSSFKGDPENVRTVATDRALAYQQPLKDGGQVIVERDFGGMGAGCYIALKIDRRLAARIGQGEKISFQVPSGTRVVGIAIDEQDDTLCGKGRLRRELAVPVAVGESYRFRITSGNQGGFDIVAE